MSFALLLFLVTGFIAVANMPDFQIPFVLLFVCSIGLMGAAVTYGLTSRKSIAAPMANILCCSPHRFRVSHLWESPA